MRNEPTVLTAQNLEIIKSLYRDPGNFIKDISEKTGVPYRAVKKGLCRLHKSGLPYIPRKSKHRMRKDTELELLSEPQLRKERRDLFCMFNDARKKTILACGDFHVPFQDEQSIKILLKEKADICFVGGDFLDHYSVSKFAKSRLIPLEREIYDGLEVLDRLSKNYAHVVMIEANHEKRLLRLLQNRLYDFPDLMKRFEQTAHILSDMSKQFKNVHVVNNWWAQIGQTIFAHPDWYAATPGKTVLNTNEYMLKDGQDYDCIANFHTHRCTKLMSFRKLLLEIPAMAIRMDYTRDGKKFKGDWSQGYALISQDSLGKTDYEKTQIKFIKFD